MNEEKWDMVIFIFVLVILMICGVYSLSPEKQAQIKDDELRDNKCVDECESNGFVFDVAWGNSTNYSCYCDRERMVIRSGER